MGIYRAMGLFHVKKQVLMRFAALLALTLYSFPSFAITPGPCKVEMKNLYLGETLQKTRTKMESLRIDQKKVIFIFGETGIGKTELAKWFVATGPRKENEMKILNLETTPQ